MKEHQEKDLKKKPAEPSSDAFQPKGPRDGLDNTGTQGADSLKDDGYTGSATKDTSGEDGTGSKSDDFPDLQNKKDASGHKK